MPNLIHNARTDFPEIKAPVQLSEKRIVRNRLNKDYDLFYCDRYIGSTATYAEAEERLNEHAYRALTHQNGSK